MTDDRKPLPAEAEMVLVPREPTEAMLAAVVPWPKHWGDYEHAMKDKKIAYQVDRLAAVHRYRAMLTAAPKATEAEMVASTELPDDIRDPLHSLQADLGWLIARIRQGDDEDTALMRQSMENRLSQIETAAYNLTAAPKATETPGLRERIARALNSALGSEADDHPRHHPAQNSWEAPSEVWWTQWLEAADAVVAALSATPQPVAVPDDGAGRDEVERYVEKCRAMSDGGKYSWWSRLADILAGHASALSAERAAHEQTRRKLTAELNEEVVSSSGLALRLHRERTEVARLRKDLEQLSQHDEKLVAQMLGNDRDDFAAARSFREEGK